MKKFLWLAIAGGLCLSACTADNESKKEELDQLTNELNQLQHRQEGLDKKQGGVPDTIKTGKGLTHSGEPVKEQVDWDKKIIKTAQLQGVVKNFDAYSAFLRQQVKQAGGYISQEDRDQTNFKIENRVVLKIPVAQFDDAVTQIVAAMEKTDNRKITSADVTGEIIDVRSRIEAKKQVRKRYMDLMAQAKTMEDILHVQSALNNMQEEIEVAAGRAEYLGNASRFSTIHLTYYEILDEKLEEETPIRANFLQQLGTAFTVGWNWIKDVLVMLVYIWPAWLGFLLIMMVYKRFLSKKRVDAGQKGIKYICSDYYSNNHGK